MVHLDLSDILILERIESGDVIPDLSLLETTHALKFENKITRTLSHQPKLWNMILTEVSELVLASPYLLFC